MAYNKQNWADGQTITAAKLNAMDEDIAEALSKDTVSVSGNILKDVSNKRLNVTMSGEGAFPKKLAVSGRNIVKMPTSGSGNYLGVTYEFTENGFNAHGTTTGALGKVVDLAPLLVNAGICLPDGFYLSVKGTMSGDVSVAVWDSGYKASCQASAGIEIGATGPLKSVALWVGSATEVSVENLQIAITTSPTNSDFTNGTGNVYDTGVTEAFAGDDSATVTVPAFENDGNTIILLTDSPTEPTFSTELGEDYSAIIEILESSNPLWGKHYHACGDSFTAGAGLTETDPSTGELLTANYLVAKYNNMIYTKDAIGGSDMTNVSGASNPFSVDRYLRIPEDTDYITLQFGLNESTIADSPDTLGTNADSSNTTMWGAYNTVLQWILTSRPNAKIGIIISDSWLSNSYADALIEIAKFWGVPWLDLGGDPQVSMNIGGRRTGSGITFSNTAMALRNKQFQIDDDDTHPNEAGNRWRYPALQEFLRRL